MKCEVESETLVWCLLQLCLVELLATFLCLDVSVFEKLSSPVSIKAVEWMEYVFAKATVVMNLCSLEKKINLNSLMQKFIKKKLD